MRCTRLSLITLAAALFATQSNSAQILHRGGAGFQSASQALPLAFTQAKNYSSSLGSPQVIAVGDLNGDGHLDLVVANGSAYGVAGSVAVLLGNGDGTFSAPTTYSFGDVFPTSVAIGDINGDGYPDLVVAIDYDSHGNGAVNVLLGNGTGTFEPSNSYESGGSGAVAIAVADVDGDGHLDVVVVSQCHRTGTCVGVAGVLLNDGQGSLKAPIKYNSGGALADSIAIADLDGDGYPDLVIANKCKTADCNTDLPTGSVGVLLNNRIGGFRAPVSYSSGGYAYGVSAVIGDLNGDGYPDIVVGNWCQSIDVCGSFSPTGGVSVLLGKGKGTFQAAVTYPSGDIQAASLAIADLNGDGHLDVAVNSGEGYANILLGNGDGTLQMPVSFMGNRIRFDNVNMVAIADLNADGRPDLLTGNLSASVGVLLNTLLKPAPTAVTSSANPSLINVPVTFTATVTSASPIRDGSIVAFYDGPVEIGTGGTKNGVASLTTVFAKAKTYSIHASYPGDAFHLKSSGYVPRGQVVTLYPSTTTLVSSPNPSTHGAVVTLTATVSSAAPGGTTGTVTFKNGATTLGTATLSGGQAVLKTAKLPGGILPITASYNGDASSAKSVGTTTQTVN